MHLFLVGWTIEIPFLPKKTVGRLQLIQNAAARILKWKNKFVHITPASVPVSFRIDHSIFLPVYKALNSFGPQYLSNLLIQYELLGLLAQAF